MSHFWDWASIIGITLALAAAFVAAELIIGAIDARIRRNRHE